MIAGLSYLLPLGLSTSLTIAPFLVAVAAFYLLGALAALCHNNFSLRKTVMRQQDILLGTP